MRKRNSKFSQFIRKVEGKPQHETHSIPAAQGVRCSFGVGYDILHQWLRREITTNEYIERVQLLSSEERLLAYYERQRLDTSILDTDPMGLYNGDRSAYERSVEYLTGYTESERQAVFQGMPDRWRCVFDSGDYYIQSDVTRFWYKWVRDFNFWTLSSPPPSASLPREESVYREWSTTITTSGTTTGAPF